MKTVFFMTKGSQKDNYSQCQVNTLDLVRTHKSPNKININNWCVDSKCEHHVAMGCNLLKFVRSITIELPY
jgi:hypothetical protein